jgi:hypothetical protein
MHDLVRIAGHHEDNGALPQVLVWTRASTATDLSTLTWLLNFKNLQQQTTHWFKGLQNITLHLSSIREINTPLWTHSPVHHAHRNSSTARKSNTRRSEGIDSAAATLRRRTVKPWGQTSWLMMTLGSYYRGVEARQCLEWSDIRDRRTVYYSYSAQWKFPSALILLQLTKCWSMTFSSLYKLKLQ